MKRRLLICGMIVSATVGAVGQTSFATHLGTSLFRYEQAYLVTGVTVLSALDDQMELSVAADFGIATQEEESGVVSPEFLIPVAVGLNFTFPSDPTTFYLGIGVVPAANLAPGRSDTVRFYLGPFAKAGLRVKVHAVMSAFLEAEQQLLFGGPTWVNTGTEIATGIHFSFPSRSTDE